MESYRSLLAWQRSHRLCVELHRVTDGAYHPRARPLFDQMRRAAVSVPANIVEGYALASTGQFRRHLGIALGSLAEVECLLEATEELEYLPPDDSARLRHLVSEAFPVLVGLAKKLRAMS